MLGFSVGQLGLRALVGSLRTQAGADGRAWRSSSPGRWWRRWRRDFTALLAARAVQGIGAAAPRVIALRHRARPLCGPRDGARDVVRHGRVHHHPGAGAGDGPGPAARRHLAARCSTLLLVAGIIVRAVGRLASARDHARRGAGEPLPLGRLAAARARDAADDRLRGRRRACMFGCVLGYVSSAQQVFVDVYRSRRSAFRSPSAAIGADDRARLADQRAAGRAARHAPAVAHGAGRLHRAVGACSSLAALLGWASFWLFIGADGAAVLPVRARRAQLQCAGHGAAGRQCRHGVVGHRVRVDRPRRAGRRLRRAHVRRQRAAAGAGLPRPQRGGVRRRRVGGGSARRLPVRAAEAAPRRSRRAGRRCAR